MSEQKKNKRKLRVTNSRQLTTFRKDDGSQGEIFEVRALMENGQPVDPQKFPLRSFSSLAEHMDKLVEYEVREYDGGEKYGISYTLIPPKRPTQQQINDLRARVDTLEEQVQALQGAVFTQKPPQATHPEPTPPQQAPPPPEQGPPAIPDRTQHPQPTSTVHRSDDDIPF